MAAILIIELLYAHAGGALATGHQNIVGLSELRLEQAIKRIGNMDLKWAAFWTRLSHAFLECVETHSTRRSRLLQWSVHCFSRTSVALPPCAAEAST